MLLGKTYIKLGNGLSAVKEFSQARDLGVARDEVLVPLGHAYLMAGQANKLLQVIRHETEDTLQTRVDILVLHGQAYLELYGHGQSYLEKQRFAKADEQFSKALALQPTSTTLDRLLRFLLLRRACAGDAIRTASKRTNAVSAALFVMRIGTSPGEQ